MSVGAPSGQREGRIATTASLSSRGVLDEGPPDLHPQFMKHEEQGREPVQPLIERMVHLVLSQSPRSSVGITSERNLTERTVSCIRWWRPGGPSSRTPRDDKPGVLSVRPSRRA